MLVSISSDFPVYLLPHSDFEWLESCLRFQIFVYFVLKPSLRYKHDRPRNDKKFKILENACLSGNYNIDSQHQQSTINERAGRT